MPLVYPIGFCFDITSQLSTVIVPLNINVDCQMSASQNAAITAQTTLDSLIDNRNIATKMLGHAQAQALAVQGLKDIACASSLVSQNALVSSAQTIGIITLQRDVEVAAMHATNIQASYTSQLREAVAQDSLLTAQSLHLQQVCTDTTTAYIAALSAVNSSLQTCNNFSIVYDTLVAIAASTKLSASPVPNTANGACINNPCLNGGTYPGSNVGYNCNCPVGFTGVLCATNTTT